MNRITTVALYSVKLTLVPKPEAPNFLNCLIRERVLANNDPLSPAGNCGVAGQMFVDEGDKLQNFSDETETLRCGKSGSTIFLLARLKAGCGRGHGLRRLRFRESDKEIARIRHNEGRMNGDIPPGVACYPRTICFVYPLACHKRVMKCNNHAQPSGKYS